MSITANFVVVEPASIPIKQSPSKFLSSRFFTVAFWCLLSKFLYSSSFSKRGSKGWVVLSCELRKLFILEANSSFEKGVSSKESKAAPFATRRWASSGIIVSSGVNFKVSINLCLSSDKYVKGPPKKAILPLIGRPHANPDIVWFTTAWKIDAAISSFAAPSFIKGCISVFAKTPHLEAIGYIVVYFFAYSFNPLGSVCNNEAIWSINAPVPPAQVPFIRCSIDLSKYIIFASSPPSSITTSVCGMYFSTALLHDTTSCIKFTFKNFATERAPEPVRARVNSEFGKSEFNFSNTLHTVFFVSE